MNLFDDQPDPNAVLLFANGFTRYGSQLTHGDRMWCLMKPEGGFEIYTEEQAMEKAKEEPK